MRSTTSSIALCLALTAIPPSLVLAGEDNMMPTTGTDSFRCGTYLVETGMSLNKVQEYCGPPTRQTGDKWIYERGPDQFTIVIHVQPDNTVGSIDEKPAEE